MRFKRHILSGIFVWVYALMIAAPQSPAQYRFNSWTTDAGLPQNTVYDILQTRDGYLWLTTFDGLVRFDGVRFTVFNKSNSPGISSNRFLRLFEDSQGDLWAGTEDGGVVRYHQGQFTSYGNEQGLTSLFGLYVTEGADGRVVVFPTNGSPSRLENGKFMPDGPIDNSLLRSAMPHTSQSVPCYPSGDRLQCIGYGSGWSVVDGMPSLNRMGRDGVRDTHGALWIAMRDAGLVKIQDEKVVHVYTDRDGLPGDPMLFVTGAHTSVLSKDGNNALWITDLETMQNRLVGSGTMADVAAYDAAYEDSEGNLWFGTGRDGLIRARKQFINTVSMPGGSSENNIYPIYQDGGGIIWVGSNGLFQREGESFKLDDTVKSYVTAITEDSSGRLIVGNYQKVWIREGGSFKLIFEVKSGVVWAIYPDNEGTIWIGWEHGLIGLKDGEETVYTKSDGLAGDDVKVIIDDGNRGLWIGSYGGLTHYSGGRFTSWTERDGLPSRTVRALYRDDGGVLWIGTYDGGMARLKDGELTRYTTAAGLFDSGVFQILEDGRGNFWMSSNRGIYRVRKQELEEFADGRRVSINSVAYGKSDGMPSIECNGGRWPAGGKMRDGKLWFPTQNGIAVIDPNEVPTNPQPPPVRVESFLVDNVPVEMGREVQIQPRQENFEIRYTALSYINSENIRFKYKLEGLDRDWVDAGVRRTAYYSHVPPGNYTFRVIAANSDGVWNTEGASVQLRIYPRFYQTWWFLSAVALGLFGSGFVAYRVRIKRLERAHKLQEEFSRKLLESQEQERQRIAAELHDSLGQSLLIIKNRIALARSDIDEKEIVEEQLEELSHSATTAIEECQEIAYNLRPYQIRYFGLSKTLYGIFMRINEVTGIKAIAEIEEIDDKLSEEAQINIYRIVQECVNNIIKHSQAINASLKVKLSGDTIELLIQDDGRGFERSEPVAVNNGRRGGFGLIGLAERVRLLSGTLEVDSEPNAGTRIRIKIPRG